MILFSIISIIFYYILCKNLVFIIDDDTKFPLKRIHFILLSISACIPYLNIVVFAFVLVGLFVTWIVGGVNIKNPDNKVFRFLNKEV